MPNRATATGAVSVEIMKHGRPVDAARVRLTTIMLTMGTGYTGLLLHDGPGRYAHPWPALLMTGRWRLHYEITPPAGKRFAVTFIDRVA